MATTSERTDMGVGLSLLFGIVAVGAAVLTTLLGFQYALEHAAGASVRTIQVNAGIAFAVAVGAACLAVAAIHVFDG